MHLLKTFSLPPASATVPQSRTPGRSAAAHRLPSATHAEEIEKLAAIGASAEEIACILTPKGAKHLIDHQTVERRFYATIKKGRTTLHRALKRELVKQALSGNTAALIFALKAHCGLREHDPATNITVNASANANREPALPTPAEMRARLVAARQFLEQNNYGLPREPSDRFDANGDSQAVPNV